jgi:acetyltransferase-like isoleucine patch superfamily enzyme
MMIVSKIALFFVDVTSLFLKLLGKGFNKLLWEWFKYSSSFVGFGMRLAIAKNLAKKIGNYAVFDPDVTIRGWENLEIGEEVYFNKSCYVNAEGGMKIGSYTMIAYYAKLITDSHNFSDKKKPMAHQGVSHKAIIIEDDVWIGAGAVVTSGRTLKKGCIIGANAVVTKDTEPYGIYGGVPAVLIRKR